MFVLQLVLFLFFQVGATIPSPTRAATLITAVTAAMQVTSEYPATTQSIFDERTTFTVRGVVFRENGAPFLKSDKGCLYVYIYTDSNYYLTSRRYSIDGERYFVGHNLYYSINFDGFQNRMYAMRMSFHKDASCYVNEYTYLDVLHVGDYYMLTKEMIYTGVAIEETGFSKDVTLTRYENGKCGEYDRCQCSEQCQRYGSLSGGYYCTTRPSCPKLEYPQWVCASNGQTYSSKCEMLTDSDCSQERVFTVGRGKCDEYFPTPRQIADNSRNAWSKQGRLKIILGVFCPLTAVIIVLIFIRRRYVSRQKAAGESYRRFPEANPTPTSSSAQTNKIDHEFFVGDPVKYEQPASERVGATNVVYLEKDDYHTAEDVTVDQTE